MKAVYLIFISAIFLTCQQEPPDLPPVETEPLQLVWSQSYEMNSWGPDAPPTILQDSLLLFTGDNNITCLRLDSGTIKWVSTLEFAGTSLKKFLFDDTRLFGWKGRDEIFCLDLSDGAELWRKQISMSRLFSFIGTIDAEHYYIGTRRDLANKYTIWKYAKDGSLVDSVHSDHMPWKLTHFMDRLFSNQGWFPAADALGQIVCYNSTSLDTSWIHSGSGSYNIAEAQFDSGILYAGTVWGGQLGNEVVALNAETGERLWSTETYGCYQIVLDGDVLYYAGSGSANALNKHTGEVLWRSIINYPDESSPLAYWDGYVYKAHGGTLFVIDAVTGERVYHTYTFNGKNEYVYQVSAGAGKIFVQTSRHLFAFEPFNPEALTPSNGEPAGFRNPLAPETETTRK